MAIHPETYITINKKINSPFHLYIIKFTSKGIYDTTEVRKFQGIKALIARLYEPMHQVHNII